VHGNAAVCRERWRQRGTRTADEVDIDTLGSQGLSVQQHAGAAAEIADHDDRRSHVGGHVVASA